MRLPHDVTPTSFPSLENPAAHPRIIAGEPLSSASERLRALAALSGSLTDALTPAAAADLVEQKALSALGASSAIVVTLGDFPPLPKLATRVPTLRVVHAMGLPGEVKAAIDQLPLDAPVPFAEVAKTGESVFLESTTAMMRFPDWGLAMAHVGAQAAAIVPVWANGELRGVLGLAWALPRIFDEDERAFVLTLGVMCAQAIMRAHLRAAELEARDAAEQANRSKAQFLATISHELRTPMNAVMGYTDLLADEICGPVTPLQKDHLGRVRESGQHLLGLIEDLLGYARVEAGEEVVRPEHVRLADVVERTLVLVRPLADRQGLNIRVEGDEQIELHTDPRKLCQILVNVLANAVKFTDKGGVVVVLELKTADANVRLVITVTDTGRGIAAQNQPRIFDAFWQEKGTDSHAGGSTGLGLAVARQLAQLLGGDVSLAASAIGAGSTFVISIPVHYQG